MPKVSVIMGVFNDELYLIKAINSILNQSYKDFEFIICDDCSTDNSVHLINSIYDDRIVFLKNEKNLGLANTLNKCIKYSKGEYIARMDSDDISLIDRLKKQVEFLDKNLKVAVIGTQGYFIDENDKRFKEFSRPLQISFDETVRKSSLIHPSTMIRKEVLVEIGGYSVNELTHRAEDYDLWCKIAERGYKLANLPEYLFEYRETIKAYKKRKYKFRIEEFKIKKYWIKRANLSIINYIYAIKPLFVGLIPSKIMTKRKIK